MSSGLTTAPSLIYPWRSWQLVAWRWEKIPWVFLTSPATSSTGNHVGFWRRQRMGSFDATAQLATREKFANMSLPSTTSTAGLRFSHMVQPFPWNYSKYLSIFCKSLIIFKHPSKLSKIVKLSKLSKINKIVKNCQKFSNIVKNCQTLSKIVRIVKDCQNCQKIVKIVKSCQNCQKIAKIVKNWKNCQQLSKC